MNTALPASPQDNLIWVPIFHNDKVHSFIAHDENTGLFYSSDAFPQLYGGYSATVDANGNVVSKRLFTVEKWLYDELKEFYRLSDHEIKLTWSELLDEWRKKSLVSGILFAPMNGICLNCHFNLAEAYRKNGLVSPTGCPKCHKSFVD